MAEPEGKKKSTDSGQSGGGRIMAGNSPQSPQIIYVQVPAPAPYRPPKNKTPFSKRKCLCDRTFFFWFVLLGSIGLVLSIIYFSISVVLYVDPKAFKTNKPFLYEFNTTTKEKWKYSETAELNCYTVGKEMAPLSKLCSPGQICVTETEKQESRYARTSSTIKYCAEYVNADCTLRYDTPERDKTIRRCYCRTDFCNKKDSCDTCGAATLQTTLLTILCVFLSLFQIFTGNI